MMIINQIPSAWICWLAELCNCHKMLQLAQAFISYKLKLRFDIHPPRFKCKMLNGLFKPFICKFHQVFKPFCL